MLDGCRLHSGTGLENSSNNAYMITKVTLENFKCFSELTSIPMSRYTVLYGKNGRGKSSVIQCLLLLSQSIRLNGGNLDSLKIAGDMVSLGTFTDIKNRYATTRKSIKMKIESDIEPELKLEYSGSEDQPTIGLLDRLYVGDVSYMISKEADSSQSSSGGEEPKDAQEVISSMPQSDIKIYNVLNQLGYVSADRRGPVNYEERRDSLPAIDVDPKGERLINHLAQKSQEFQQRFEQELSLILSGASVRVFANKETPDRIDLYLDSSTGNSKGFKPTNVGYGYSYVLPIVYKTLDAPVGGVVVVENPEAHLYPGAQSRLVDFLVKYAKRNHLQIILETHSDHIVNGLRLAVKESIIEPDESTILFFDRDEDETGTPDIVRIRIDKRGGLDSQPRDFMDEWTRQMLALL